MQEYAQTHKPLVSILMAVYKPNEKWLCEQLSSLNGQTYPELELVIYDDCPDCPLDEAVVREHITAFPYRIIRGEKNLGSNKSFERLTIEGRGKYFSYCDQDDVWHSDKIERMTQVLENTGCALVCSDLAIVDGNGKRIADSITAVRRRHVFHEGTGLADSLLIRNFVTGCAMMIRADIAKSALPFVDTLVHDHWLAIIAALNGSIEVIRAPLIDYRQHSNNQTGVLKGITTKQDYYDARINNTDRRLADYKARLNGCGNIGQAIAELEQFNEARKRYFYSHKISDLRVMIKYRKFAKPEVMIEAIMPFVPNRLMKPLFRMIQNGRL